MIFELVKDFAAVLEAMPAEHPRRRILKLLEEAIRRDVHFIDRHPTTLFQCMWNSCWWYDSPEAAKYYDPTAYRDLFSDNLPREQSEEALPWHAVGAKLSDLLREWHHQRNAELPKFYWIRTRRPLARRLDAGPRARFTGHAEWVECLSFSPDASFLVSASRDATARVWDLRTGSQFHVLEGHRGWVRCAVFSWGGRRLATGSTDGTIRLWDTLSGNVLHSLTADCDVRSVAFSPDGESMAAGMADGTVRLWNTKNGELLWTSNAEGLTVLSIGLSKTRDTSMDACVKNVINNHAVAFTSDGGQIGSGFSDGTLRLWRVADGAIIFSSPSGSPLRPILALSRDCSHYVTADSYLILPQICDFKSRRMRSEFYHRSSLTSVCFSADSQFVASSAVDKTTRIWNVTTGKHEYVVPAQLSVSLAYSRQRRLLVSGLPNGTIEIWNTDEKPDYIPLKGEEDFRFDEFAGAGFSADGNTVECVFGVSVTPPYDEKRYYDTQTGKFLRRGPYHGEREEEHPHAAPPWECLQENGEIVVRRRDNDQTVGWLPDTFEHLAGHPTQPVWAGGSRSSPNLSLFGLEVGEFAHGVSDE